MWVTSARSSERVKRSSARAWFAGGKDIERPRHSWATPVRSSHKRRLPMSASKRAARWASRCASSSNATSEPRRSRWSSKSEHDLGQLRMRFQKHEGRSRLLRRGPGRLQPQDRWLVHRLPPGRHPRRQRPRHGHPQPAPEPGGIVPTDHGSQFTSWVFGDKIRSAGPLPSSEKTPITAASQPPRLEPIRWGRPNSCRTLFGYPPGSPPISPDFGRRHSQNRRASSGR